MRRALPVLALAALLALSVPATAAAAERQDDVVSAAEKPVTVHPDIAYALSVVPGGQVRGSLSAVWPATGMRLDVQASLLKSVGSCPTGSICAYSATGLGGTRLSWPTCGSKSTAALGQVGSIANARPSGLLRARQGTTVHATAAANSYVNVPLVYRPTITNVFC